MLATVLITRLGRAKGDAMPALAPKPDPTFAYMLRGPLILGVFVGIGAPAMIMLPFRPR